MSFLAVIDTSYTTYAIADTATKAKKLAIQSAKVFIDKSGFPMTLAEIEDNIGCNVFEIPNNSAIQEY